MSEAELDHEGRLLAQRLASLIGTSSTAVAGAIRLQNDSYLPDKRNLIAVLASIAQLIALAEDLQQTKQSEWWKKPGPGGRTPLAQLEAGEVNNVCRQLVNRKAGPYDVEFDQHWPADVARRKLRDSLPSGVRAGDTVTAGNGGARLKLRVIKTTDGTLTAEPLADSWIDPPFEDVATQTYARLEKLFHDAIPPLG
jgi:hypothetical protein